MHGASVHRIRYVPATRGRVVLRCVRLLGVNRGLAAEGRLSGKICRGDTCLLLVGYQTFCQGPGVAPRQKAPPNSGCHLESGTGIRPFWIEVVMVTDGVQQTSAL